MMKPKFDGYAGGKENPWMEEKTILQQRQPWSETEQSGGAAGAGQPSARGRRRGRGCMVSGGIEGEQSLTSSGHNRATPEKSGMNV